MKLAVPLATLMLAAASLQARAATVCTVVADVATGRALVRDGRCDARVTPASTFKIAIALMGYDSGFLTDEHTPALPFRAGYPDWNPAWRQTTDPTRWIAQSVVWYSQQVTRSLGAARFARYAAAFDYGNHDVSGDPGRHDGLTRAWLSSSLEISPLEQVAFLEKLVGRRLPVAPRAIDMTERITAIAVLPGGWDVHGKTGTGFPRRGDGSQDRDHAYGWFVGWATRGTCTVAFARLVQDEARGTTAAGPRARDAMLADLPTILAMP